MGRKAESHIPCREMPPNAKGGKGYKKQKKGGDEATQSVKIDRQADQMVARALRMLGNRNVLCFCNDNVMRICHIRGKMKCGKSRIETRVEPGDIVLITVREFTVENPKEAKRGDIVAKYAPDLLRDLRREPGINERLFMKLEVMEGLTLDEVGVDKTKDKKLERAEEEDCGFVIEASDSEEGEGSEDAEERNEIVGRPMRRGGRAAAATAAMNGDGGDSDIDIDDI